MIRDGDETVNLNDRYQDARKYGADIFISIHADGFRLSSVKGASAVDFSWSDRIWKNTLFVFGVISILRGLIAIFFENLVYKFAKIFVLKTTFNCVNYI